ncbi:type I restriction endonuclease [Aquitalea aquatilis]|uniref:type I restriction endonuclease n=1 Tax=Aquitalea aquatilis TaxID=1537400 RepID=UPI0010BD0422|nr:type I restriction endonuclease [Aquitalea aquatilis]
MSSAFKDRVLSHIDHVKKNGALCSTEETTKQALILPLLDILGFSAFDPSKIKAEYQADFPGAKAGERVDYALFCNGLPVMYVEAKPYGEKLDNHCPQLSRYFNASPEVAVSAITNGREWRFFTDLTNKNVMDKSPFLTIDLLDITENDIQQLNRFRHDQFQPESLRVLAEESIYLTSFTKAIIDSLRDVDQDFVKYVANRANVERQLNQRFVESITPLVRQAVEQSVSAMVVSGLSAPIREVTEQGENNSQGNDSSTDDLVVDPANPRIITTPAERMIFDNAKLVLGDEADIQAKDTESYFSILFQGKTNRWLLRYYDGKQRPTIQFPFQLSDQSKAEITRAGLEIGSGEQVIIDRPENLLRLPGLLFDALSYASNNENFRRK